MVALLSSFQFVVALLSSFQAEGQGLFLGLRKREKRLKLSGQRRDFLIFQLSLRER